LKATEWMELAGSNRSQLTSGKIHVISRTGH
jgi:hypothetical protein